AFCKSSCTPGHCSLTGVRLFKFNRLMTGSRIYTPDRSIARRSRPHLQPLAAEPIVYSIRFDLDSHAKRLFLYRALDVSESEIVQRPPTDPRNVPDIATEQSQKHTASTDCVRADVSKIHPRRTLEESARPKSIYRHSVIVVNQPGGIELINLPRTSRIPEKNLLN